MDHLESSLEEDEQMKKINSFAVLLIGIVLILTVFLNNELLGEEHMNEDELFSDKEEKDNLVQDNKDWMLMLVNDQNPLPHGYSPKLKSLENGLEFDERAIDDLNEMLADAWLQGLSPVVCSAYRSVEYQQELFDNQMKKQMDNGLGMEEAVIETKKAIAYPGTSEHNSGLAVDIVSLDYQILDEKQATTPEIEWLIENCSQYGFILRYPKDKTDITGVIYEPWHFRFVGKQAAKEIMNNGITLEEYLLGDGVNYNDE